MPDGESRPVSASGSRHASHIVDPAWVAIEWTLARAARTARFWWIVVGYFCALVAWYAVQVHQTKYLTEIGFTACCRLGAWRGECTRRPWADHPRRLVGSHRPRMGVDGRMYGLRYLLCHADRAGVYSIHRPALHDGVCSRLLRLRADIRDGPNCCRDFRGTPLRIDFRHDHCGIDWWWRGGALDRRRHP